jgi:peptidoglycan hydrolase-like protein with peptidoglycan-binding domain
MSKAGGLVLILGGLAVAAYVMPSDNDASGPDAAGQVDVAKSARADERPSQDLTVPRPQPAFRPLASATARAAEPVPAFSAPVVVTVAPRPSEVAGAQPRATAIPKDRDALARELQKELRRVGCYDGELNGAWTPSTRRAMKAFTDRVNASLPIEEPDAVLFTMVASHRDTVCGKPCPAGQGIGEDGRCLPNAILAKAAKKAPPPATVAQLPKSDPAPAARRAPAIASWSTTVTAAAPVPLPAVAAAPAVAPIPTEGRMGLAGPKEEPKPAAGSNPPARVKPHVRVRAAARARPPRVGPRVVSALTRGTFARTVFRRIDSSL